MKTFPTRTSRAVELLEQLGTTRDLVAEALADLGCVGDRDESGTCPVAVYLMRSDLGLYAVAVDDQEIALFHGPGDDDVEYIDTPDPVRHFIPWFDHGFYPQLDRQPEAVAV